MHLVLLPGNSPANEPWIEEVEKALKPHFEETFVQKYKHWQTGGGYLDLEYELQVLAESVPTNYAIFAKSAGVSLTIKGIFEKKIAPQKCIFVGTPFSSSSLEALKRRGWLKGYFLPSLFIQQEQDPVASYEEIKKILEALKVKNCQIVKLPGDSHHYADVEKLKELTVKFLGV